ncbi:hypothetical protein GYMLUDRAFT_259188 [Collybiopsis luxurians FD-317 M1]|uniref:Uncharacterized protein n=1 Tax=Collybiopsis luxurians FD-317 M1 TaxID=944289 RepID=A0A0D0C7K7_9AGAR|nr:hypothetical protein GYMLUDRAFT_259188 [Collybiopsis luxurians FD-317 M1]
MASNFPGYPSSSSRRSSFRRGHTSSSSRRGHTSRTSQMNNVPKRRNPPSETVFTDAMPRQDDHCVRYACLLHPHVGTHWLTAHFWPSSSTWNQFFSGYFFDLLDPDGNSIPPPADLAVYQPSGGHWTEIRTLEGVALLALNVTPLNDHEKYFVTEGTRLLFYKRDVICAEVMAPLHEDSWDPITGSQSLHSVQISCYA